MFNKPALKWHTAAASYLGGFLTPLETPFPRPTKHYTIPPSENSGDCLPHTDYQSIWQWTSIYLCRILWIYESQWNQTHKMCSISSIVKCTWMCWKIAQTFKKALSPDGHQKWSKQQQLMFFVNLSNITSFHNTCTVYTICSFAPSILYRVIETSYLCTSIEKQPS